MNITQTSKLYTIFLSVLPVISVYRMPWTSLSLATVLTALMLLVALISLFQRRIKVPIATLLPFIVYLVYVITKSNIISSVLFVALMVHIMAISTGVVRVRLLRRTIEFISVVAAVCVLFQQIIHLATGLHVSLFISNLLLGELKELYDVALTTATIDGMYRPSAFFLEPAHFSQYCIIGLGSCLFSGKTRFNKAILISIGVLATTSGMGLVVTIAMWGWWYLSKIKFSLKHLLALLLMLLVAFFILNQISFTHSIISRITSDPESGDYNAIYGRLWWWDTFFGDFSFSGFLFGFGQDSLPEGAYFTSFMSQLFCYGIIGTLLLFFSLFQLLFKSDDYGKACVFIYILLLFFADITGYVSLLFFIGTFLSFYLAGGKQCVVQQRRFIFYKKNDNGYPTSQRHYTCL